MAGRSPADTSDAALRIAGNDMDVAAALDSLSFSSNSPAWLILGMGVMALIYLTIRPKKRDPLAQKGGVRISIGQQKALERDMQNVIVELSELTRQMSAQMDTRAAKLELLIRDADERIAHLQAATDAAGAAKAIAAAKPTLSLAAPDESGVVAAIDVPAPAKPVRGMRLADDSADRWNDVYRFADEGLGAREIARRMNRPQGEVELILALRPKPRALASTEVAAAVG